MFSKENHYGEKSFRDFRKVLMSSTNQLFPQDFTRLGNFLRFFWSFLERYLAETFRTINEVKVFEFEDLFLSFGTTPWCILRPVTLISVTVITPSTERNTERYELPILTTLARKLQQCEMTVYFSYNI